MRKQTSVRVEEKFFALLLRMEGSIFCLRMHYQIFHKGSIIKSYKNNRESKAMIELSFRKKGNGKDISRTNEKICLQQVRQT